MNQMKEDEARSDLIEAEKAYREIEDELVNPPPGQSTAERVIREVELKAALVAASETLVRVRGEFTGIKEANQERRRTQANVDLAATETALVAAVEDAESNIATLASSLTNVMDLSKKRYGYRQEATGRAPRSMLARNSVVGWIKYRLRDLDLPEFAAPKYYRAPLAELLGLADTPDFEDTHYPQEST